MEEKFYCIKLINGDTGQRGYVIDDGPDKGIRISLDAFVSDCITFPSYQKAHKFIRERKLEKGKIKTYIRDNEDVIKESESGETSGLISVDVPVYYAENLAGEKMFYDKQKQEYYFKQGDVGYPVWPDKDELVKGLKDMNWPFDVQVKIKESKKK